MTRSEQEYLTNERASANASAPRSLDWYARHLRVWSDIEVRTVLSHLRADASDRVLDVGCGSGRIALAIAPRVHSLWAIDVAENCLSELRAEAQRRHIHNIHTRRGSATDVNYCGMFDKATAIGVIQHIPTRESRVRALRRIWYALQPGGRFVTVNYRWGGGINATKTGEHEGGRYFTSYTPDELRTELMAAGFKSIRVTGCVNTPARLERIAPLLKGLDVLTSHSRHSIHTGRYLIATAKA